MKKIILISIVLVVFFFIFSTLYHAGVFNKLNYHSKLSEISILTNVAGTEDLAIDRDNGLLFISSTDRWKQQVSENSEDGIYLLDLNSNALPQKMQTTYKGDFHPHGISFLRKSNQDYLFAINHNQQGNFVEVFQIENNRLIHINSFQHKLMCCPNDLVAVDIDKFYVTNDHGAAKGVSRVLEDYLRIANSYVLYFDGNQFKKVYKNLNYANGINLSRDGSLLYVTETTGRRLSVLERDPLSGGLQLKFTKQFDTGLDNITIDDDNNLWIASHPKLLKFVGHAADSATVSPSQVLKLSPLGNTDFKLEEMYLNNGEQISGSSTALYYQGKVYVGVVFESKLMIANSISNP